MLKAATSVLRQYAARLVAVAAIIGTYGCARLPVPDGSERASLANRFSFTHYPLPEVAGPAPRSVRPVNPSLGRISAWISSVGAAVALGDFDGDGLPDDVCAVDTRTDQVIVSPAPVTPARYQPFVLDPGPALFDRATMAPMGCLPGDLNEDGVADLLVYYWGRTPVAFLGRGGPLDSTAFSPLPLGPPGERWYSNAATLADVDGDGHADLVLGNYFPDGARILDAAAPTRESMQDSMSRAYNGGGLRLLLWQAVTEEPGATEAVPAVRSVRFEDDSAVLDGEVTHGWTLAVGAADLDGDLLPEIYVANDFGPDRLLHNQSSPGRPSFARLEGRRTLATPSSKVLGRDSFKGMGVDFGDLNGDGLLDLYVSNIAAEHALEESHFAFLSTGRLDLMQRGEAPYVDASERLGLSRSSWAWEARLADFDNDGVLEALQATGFVKGATNRWPELQELAMGNDQLLHLPGSWPRLQPGDGLSGQNRNPFFVRGPDGRYVDVGDDLGLREPYVSRGIATADVDGDGRLDFAVANQWGPSSFFHNECRQCGAFLGLHVRVPLHPGDVRETTARPGHPSAEVASRPAIGASATVYLADGRRLVAQVDGGNGHSGKRSPDLHLGLGDAPGSVPLRVELRWRDPGGRAHSETLHLSPGWHTVLLAWPTGREE
jgi:hypothetical protein